MGLAPVKAALTDFLRNPPPPYIIEITRDDGLVCSP